MGLAIWIFIHGLIVNRFVIVPVGVFDFIKRRKLVRHGVKGVPRTPAGRGKDFVCESCHGPGAQHSEEGEGGGILALGAKSPESQDVKNKICLQCHNKGKVAMCPSC